MKKTVMRRAWEIYRTLVGDRIAKLSQALKMAWEEVKNTAKKAIFKMPKTIRIYGDIISVYAKGGWKKVKYGDRLPKDVQMYEIKYTEYFDDGTLHCIGTEDFSPERLKTATKVFDVYCYNGKTMHGAYREGYRMTDKVGTMRVSANAVKIRAAKLIYGAENVARVD